MAGRTPQWLAAGNTCVHLLGNHVCTAALQQCMRSTTQYAHSKLPINTPHTLAPLCTDVPTRLVSHKLHPGWPRLCKHRAWRHWRPTVCWPAASLQPLEASKLYTWVGQTNCRELVGGLQRLVSGAVKDISGIGLSLQTPHTGRAFSWHCCCCCWDAGAVRGQ